MTEISALPFEGNNHLRSARLRPMGQNIPQKPRIKVGLLDDAGEVTARLTFDGRDAWALDQLINADRHGCTPIDSPAPRWSHYIWKLRRAGVVIGTHDEPHGGTYAGHHARYELHSPLVVLENTFSESVGA